MTCITLRQKWHYNKNTVHTGSDAVCGHLGITMLKWLFLQIVLVLKSFLKVLDN